MNYDWIPLTRLGPFEFRGDIRRLVESCIVIPLKSNDDSTGWDTYGYGKDAETRVHIENDLIVTVACYERCILHGRNLIGLEFDSAKQLIGCGHDEVPDIIEIDDEPQEVYEFDDAGAQVWVKDGKVITVFCSAYDDDL